ncbi:hypothetical protein AY601_4052 [Pedobacter cryoconitis]|uniref:Uncharacterized protein n=1 Tax=Pedobacter cryoconitis TaxID=188932 RepID=A0A127VHX2_9SPHI|nr:hypothetical protein AY601_4052 [Pedobacter cryoconitis]
MKKLLLIPVFLLFFSAVPANRVGRGKPVPPINRMDILNQKLDSINILLKST